MTETDSNISASELQERLPEDWQVKDGGTGVYGHADGSETSGLVGPDGVRACFSIQPDCGLWIATWKEPHKLGDDLREVSERVTGVMERCLAWIIERAYDSGDRAPD